MHLQAKVLLLSGLVFFNEKQLIKDIRFRNKIVELLDEKLTLFVESLNHRDDQSNKLRIIFTLFIFTILALNLDYFHYCVLNE